MSYPRQQGGPVAVPSQPPPPPELTGPFAPKGGEAATAGNSARTAEANKYSKIAKFVNALPVMHQCWAWTCFILNCIIPGIGTLLAALIVLTCCAKHDGIGDRCRVSCIQFWSGIGMLVTSPLIIGFIWAAWWGWMYVPISLLRYHGSFKTPHDQQDDAFVVVTDEKK
ncbi:protein SPEC3-like [Saccoglossus kowalevskii]|uniref:Uncharacterized protein LOC100369772 isoform X2 n=1 Tax=Saccoglossus kowalevskii TaxID=10224 RepID=A0ABM0MCD0_SACKO|nr:PREDICTED: uncharacterized protein LOC100369772 isoform X2 [Saccoglossus kowalevskii]XP_006817671.1 PREDICTED: uncharacterized protein LOC100369772 isoform X3 [Saccoglossus kowalevskii]